MMEITARPDIDLSKVPAYAISADTQRMLSCMLNYEKLLLSPTTPRLRRDYRGLAELMGIQIIFRWYPSRDHVKVLLSTWRKDGDSTLAKLQSFLKQIDRYDVLKDTTEMFYNDAIQYMRERDNNLWRRKHPERIPLAVDDVLDSGTSFDAFILYVKEDEEFATMLIQKLESEPFNFKLFVKDRDLLPGTMFGGSAMVTLFTKLCDHLIIIISNEFLQSEEDRFFHLHVQDLSYKAKARIIPVFYKEVEPTNEYSIYYPLNLSSRERASKLYDVWQKLAHAIRTPSNKKIILPSSAPSLRAQEGEPRGVLPSVASAAIHDPDTVAGNNVPVVERKESAGSSLQTMEGEPSGSSSTRTSASVQDAVLITKDIHVVERNESVDPSNSSISFSHFRDSLRSSFRNLLRVFRNRS